MRVCDLIPEVEDKRDPRTGRRGIDNFASFMKFLAPAGRGPIGEAARVGEQVFGAIGCAACHTPSTADRAQRQSALPPSSGRALLGPAAARHRDRRRHRAGCGGTRGDSHAGALGAPFPQALPARWLRRNARGNDRASRATRQSSRGADTSARPKATAPHCWRFSVSVILDRVRLKAGHYQYNATESGEGRTLRSRTAHVRTSPAEGC